MSGRALFRPAARLFTSSRTCKRIKLHVPPRKPGLIRYDRPCQAPRLADSQPILGQSLVSSFAWGRSLLDLLQYGFYQPTSYPDPILCHPGTIPYRILGFSPSYVVLFSMQMVSIPAIGYGSHRWTAICSDRSSHNGQSHCCGNGVLGDGRLVSTCRRSEQRTGRQDLVDYRL